LKQQTTSFIGKKKTCLHLVLVVGVFLYLYSPFLDHWLGNESYARPHNHVHISHISPPREMDSLEQVVDSDQHEEAVLCSLDIDMILALLLAFNMELGIQIVQHQPLVSELFPHYFPVSTVYLATIDRPPII